MMPPTDAETARLPTTWVLVSGVFLRDIVRQRRVTQKEPAITSTPEVSLWVEQNLGIEPDAQQSRVLQTSVTRGILNCTRQWGKSTIAAAKAVYHAVHNAESLTIVVSPTGRQSAELVRKAEQFTRRLGIKVKGDGNNEISILYPNGSRIVGLPGNEGTIRGFSAVSLLLVDEASRVSDDLYKAIRPMLAVSGGALWLLSTPYGQRGFFYEAWRKGDWERIRVPATECPRIKKEFLDEELATMGDQWFNQEYLCGFNQAEGALFDREMLERAIDYNIPVLYIPPYDE
jgi:hypothetical protein